MHEQISIYLKQIEEYEAYNQRQNEQLNVY
jgi:hypothetical protein